MANKRTLKKIVNETADELFVQCLFYCLYIPREYSDDVERLMAKISVFQHEFLKRLNTIDGKDNPKIVKTYFSKFRKDMQVSIDTITSEMDKLGEKVSEDVKLAN